MTRTITSVDHALNYAQRGWSAIPVPHRSKRPLLSGWEQLRLTTETIPEHFHCRTQNIGVLLGEPSGWLVDVDLDHSRAVELAAKFLPPTAAIFGRTSKPRSHWLYYVTSPVATAQSRLPDRTMVIEIRSTGGQTIFPGSVHPSGEGVTWDADGEPGRVAPEDLKSSVRAIFDEVCRRLGVVIRVPASASDSDKSVRAPEIVVERARRYLAKLPPAVSGQGGHDATFRAACALVIGFGLDRRQALALLRDWNETCQPTWSETELDHKVQDAMKQPGWRGHLLAGSLSPALPPSAGVMGAVARATRHAIAHRRRGLRRAVL